MFEIDGYQLVITGEAEITRGPLGRFVDLACQIQAEGLVVPPEILAVLEHLQQAPGLDRQRTD